VRRKQKIETSKEEVLNSDEMAMRNRQVGAGASRSQQQTVETVVRETRKIGRNEKVEILHIVSGERKTVKFKQAEPLLAKGEWVLADPS
jgi:preprotein translocase subunit SecA